MAAQVASYDLSLRQEGDRVLFGVALNTQEAPVVEVTRDLRIPDPPSLRDLPAQLPSVRVFILDDAAASRRILEHQLHVHCPSSCVRVFGDAESDIDLFMAMAVNDADIVILDQHLDYAESYLGTNIVRRLLLLGYEGMVCIRSGDDAPEDQERYAECGAHCFLGKDLAGGEFVERLTSSYEEFQRRRGAMTLSWPDETSLQ
eukprot:TRINITY_DN934_c0_g1_i2.p1 TRINITY_DN934_c0_g1~~TRINITY_DN934_c0_g1_i2.p1  ORF type:complete len:216 (-),score=36.18 TRINITY_DN934_c0_g1_i2:317-922(-)